MSGAEDREFIRAVRDVLGMACLRISSSRGEVEAYVPRRLMAQVLTCLRDDPVLRMAQLMDICAVDYPARRERFDIVYQLLSLTLNRRLRIITQTDEILSVPSGVEVFPSAGWFEREIYDLFGVAFEGHPDLRRILTDYGFEGHPLRRDFPLMGFKQVRYDDLNQCVAYEPVSLQQDYRAFDAQSPWQGLTDAQRRGKE